MRDRQKKRVLPLFLMLALALAAAGCTPEGVPEVSEPVASTASAEVTDAPFVDETPVAEAVEPTEASATVVSGTATAADVGGDVHTGSEALAEAGIALDLSSPLLTGVTLETIPVMGMVTASGPRDLVQPAHTLLLLEGYAETGNYRPAQIVIYPVAAYETLALGAQRQVAQLQLFLASEAGEGVAGASLPYLPLPNAAQILQARTVRLPFQNGEGVRYLTQFVQDTSPVVSTSLLYTFQGMTTDGRFWISAEAPVGSEALPADIMTAQEQGFDSFAYNFDRVAYDAYLTEQTALVEGLDEGAFYPDLAALDALIQSLDLSAYEGPDVAEWAPEVAPSPAQVVDAFLEEYLAAGGYAAGAHRDNAHLDEAFVAELETLAGDIGAGGAPGTAYDPILMSVMGPAEAGAAGYGFAALEVGPTWSEGEEATALVARKWHSSGVASPLRFTLRWNGEAWLIRGVSSNVAPVATEPEKTAEALMTSLAAATGQFETVQAWQSAAAPDFLVPNASLSLCDESWPVGFAIEGSFVQRPPLHLSSNVQEEARVVVYLPFERGVLTVRLVREAEAWQVSEMICGDTREGRALAFYAWYLGAAQKAGETRWAARAPEIDGINGRPTFVTDAFLREAQINFQDDAYLPSGRVPDRYVVEVILTVEDEDIAVQVRFEYLAEDRAQVDTVALAMEQVGEVWLVSGVKPVPD